MLYSLLSLLIAIITGFDFLIVTLLVYLITFLPQSFTKNWYYPLFRFWCKTFIRALGVTLKYHQKNRFSLPKHYILIGNHPSAFEDIGMPFLFNARFLAKEEMKDWWIFGRISRFARTLYVKRHCRDSRKQALETLINALQRGENVGLYPEAGCKGRRIFLPFRYGAFEAALKTNTPLLPVFLHYESQEDFEWAHAESLVQKLWRIYRSHNKTVNYYVFDAIKPEEFSTKEALCEHVQKLYLDWQSTYLE